MEGVPLIVISMFAVLGAYYCSELICSAWFRRKKHLQPVVVLQESGSGEIWADIPDVRAAMPDVPIVLLCGNPHTCPPDGRWRGITVASPETLAQTVQSLAEKG